MKKSLVIFFSLCTVIMAETNVVQRFPKPQFETPYVQPEPTMPAPRSLFQEYADVIVLFAALSLASFAALKMRSRKTIFLLMILSLLYFGFWREGCVCPVGSLQNIALALSDSSYAIPVTVLLFFMLPVIFTLFFGRTFCAAVCPLGAIQDLVVIKPMRMSGWLSATLGLFPYIYLSFAVLFAATGAGFIICRYDPFVGLFRFGASFKMFLLAACILIIGFAVARPYCRFICPYGVILNWMSIFSQRHLTITPDECIRCRLCEESCPFDAIKIPAAEPILPDLAKNRVRLLWLLILTPVVIVLSAWAGSRSSFVLSRVHPSVRLAERIQLEDAHQVQDTTLESRTFRSSGKPTEQLYDEVSHIRSRIKTGAVFVSAFIALVFMLKLMRLMRYQRVADYEPDQGQCLSCGRCFSYCPLEHVRLGLISRESLGPDVQKPAIQQGVVPDSRDTE